MDFDAGDKLILAQLQANGSDLSKLHKMTHYLIFAMWCYMRRRTHRKQSPSRPIDDTASSGTRSRTYKRPVHPLAFLSFR